MSNLLITEELVRRVDNLLTTKTGLVSRAISYEIQDEYQHLLISISIDGLAEDIQPSSFKPVAGLLNDLIPSRRGDHTWMMVLKKNGKVVDSYFGGDLNFPNSGLS